MIRISTRYHIDGNNRPRGTENEEDSEGSVSGDEPDKGGLSPKEKNRVSRYEQYKNDLSTTEGREEWNQDAAIGHVASLCASIGSALLFLFGLIKAKKNPGAGAAAALTGAAAFLASRETSIISENKGIIATRMGGYKPKFLSSEKEFSKAIFKDTNISGFLFDEYYINWLKEVPNQKTEMTSQNSSEGLDSPSFVRTASQ